jgi:hypothetical protein
MSRVVVLECARPVVARNAVGSIRSLAASGEGELETRIRRNGKERDSKQESFFTIIHLTKGNDLCKMYS